jgi:predicted AAA+ superfamily ATPase
MTKNAGISSHYLSKKLVPWDEVMDPSQDGKSAPSLWEVVLKEAPEAYNDPEKFFERTYFSRSLNSIIDGIHHRLGIKKGSVAIPNVLMLASRFGGGKTHAMIALYHAFSSPEKLSKLDHLIDLTEKKDIEIIPLDADSRRLVPHPLEASVIENFRITTIWGMLAYRLGEYDKLKHLDGAEKPVPDTNTLKDLVRGKRAIILVDEIAKYAFNMQRSSLTANYGEKVITSFCKDSMNLMIDMGVCSTDLSTMG